MKKLATAIVLAALLPLAGCTVYGLGPAPGGAWANYDGSYQYGMSGYGPGGYCPPGFGDPNAYYGGYADYGYGGSAGYGAYGGASYGGGGYGAYGGVGYGNGYAGVYYRR